MTESKPKKNNFIDYNNDLEEEKLVKKEDRLIKTDEKKKSEPIPIIQKVISPPKLEVEKPTPTLP